MSVTYRVPSQVPIPGIERNAAPYLYGPEHEALSRVLAQGQYGHTAETEEFESELASFLGVPDVVAVASGTTALQLALHAAGISAGDEVVVPSMTFCATVQAVLAVGASPRFAEIDPDTLCVTADSVAAALTASTRAVLPVLYGGRAVDLDPLRAELTRRRITVVEDAAHAFGSRHGRLRVGATGELTCFSFGPIKNLTCGQGGAVVPRHPLDAAALRTLRGLGIAESAEQRAAATGYRVTGHGLRAGLPALNAAIGRVQLAHRDRAERERRTLWTAYREALADIDGVRTVDVDVARSVPSLCAVRVPIEQRDRTFVALRAAGVGVGVHYPPNHLQPAFRAWTRPMPVTEQTGREILTLPFHQHLRPGDPARVADALRQALAGR
ncbi:DegT/DnrJ/EryC1/StrS family aminotransferase [Phaeacidiphilus oryzae]|uniref:DegT/DnrJ/EryC1/StrS family aminotransferase n=1 Tax=Phaeacidiphilus oryzae TaxID=348818 RepID=UPI0006920C8F|nr:DegT/DnrJ/EryC1/StrS family aminotransferase [Phaeacidiphilus oryzae]